VCDQPCVRLSEAKTLFYSREEVVILKEKNQLGAIMEKLFPYQEKHIKQTLPNIIT